MKGTKDDRMVIAYLSPALHKEIRMWCLNEGIPLWEWAEKAHKALAK